MRLDHRACGQITSHVGDLAFNVVASLLGCALFAGLSALTYKTAKKANAKANADVRASYAQERMASALERLADAADRGGLPRPSLLPSDRMTPTERVAHTASSDAWAPNCVDSSVSRTNGGCAE